MKIKICGENGEKLDADIYEEQIGSWTEYTIESRGGTRGSQNQRNPDYLEAFEKLLEHLVREGCEVRDILVNSAKLKNRPTVERRVNLAGREFPFSLAHAHPGVLRRQITKAAADVARAPNSKGPGNPTRKLQLIISKGNNDIFVDYEDEHFVLLDQNPTNHLRTASGPPPSSSRAAVNRSIAGGFTYALALQGSDMSVIKIGFTSDLVRRIRTLNREIRPTLTKCRWILINYWKFDSEQKAYEFEQQLLLLFKEHLVSGEREIISFTHDEFLNTVADFIAEQKRKGMFV
jgi:hypothetical protein